MKEVVSYEIGLNGKAPKIVTYVHVYEAFILLAVAIYHHTIAALVFS